MTELKHWHLETDAHGILWCHLDQQGTSANVLSAEVLAELEQIVTLMEQDLPRGAVILSDKDSGFIAGADIQEFAQFRDREQVLATVRQAHALFNRLAALACPTLSLVHGYCLGGGLELALACRYRVAVDGPETRLGLPEVLLGIHPGIGGSVRMPQITGAIAAMPLMLSGRHVDARRALRLGLVDRAVPGRQMRNAAEKLILQQPPARRPGLLHRLASHGLLRPGLARLFRWQLRQRVNPVHYPAPYALLDLWRSYAGKPRVMLEQEAMSVADLFLTETSRNLVRLFQLREKLKSAGTGQDFASCHVHVVGAGVMGGDIAAWCVLRGCTVSLQDRGPQFIAPAIKRAYALFEKRLKPRSRIMAAMDRLLPDPAGQGMTRADLVIEAINENLEAKRLLFLELERRARPAAMLATNTSSIPLDEISQGMTRPERLVGLHFFNPVASMQLVEVVYSDRTASDNIARAAAFCRHIDRLPLPVRSAPGFLVNRVLTPYLLEAVTMIEEGIPATVVDAAAEHFGMPLGPVALADSVGLDICLSVADNLARSMPVRVPEGLRQMVAAGHLGRKSNHGYYRYRGGRVLKTAQPLVTATGTDLQERLVLRLLNECVACLREGIVTDPDQVDAALVFGAGFAPFRGGPLRYARQQGYNEILERYTALELSYGPRFKADPGWAVLNGGNV